MLFSDFQDPPDLFSDDGTLTPDPLREDGTDESPLHMNAKNLANNPRGIPTEKLKKIRINRKDFKKGGDGLRGKNVTEQFRVKEKDMKRTMKWHTPEFSMKNFSRNGSSGGPVLEKPPDSKKKHERQRKSAYKNDTEGSSEDILDDEDDEVSSVYRKISERREELNRARRNGDDCHVSWYPVSFGSEMNHQYQQNNHRATAASSNISNQRQNGQQQQTNDENAILLLDQEQLVAVCNGKSSSIERARAKRSSRL